MNYDVNRISRLYNKTFNNKPNSLERTEALKKLSEADREALFDFDMGIRSGRIPKPNYEQEQEGSTMDYETFKRKSESNASGTMLELSQFAKRSPEMYKEYRAKYQEEKDEQRRIHNRKIMGY